jgi:phosphotransferase system  glucose/maltose/N-acetylglucosamine-specific IIC component
MLSRLRFYGSLLWHADFLSPKDFVRRAIFLGVAFLIVHLAGLKDFTTILNGTMGSIQLGWGMSAFLGLLYICAWLGFVVLAPILLLAAVLLAIWNRVRPIPSRRRREETLTHQ